MQEPNKKKPQNADSIATIGNDTPTQEDNKGSQPVEIGGRDGPEPTRYGDWEKAGRCIDF